jgi:hypothetical protein
MGCPSRRRGFAGASAKLAVPSEARADRYLGHAGTTVSDRYRHRLRGQLETDAELLGGYLRGEAAPVVALPMHCIIRGQSDVRRSPSAMTATY